MEPTNGQATAVTTEPGPVAPPPAVPPPGSLREQIQAMVTGYWVSQICGTIARLGLADRLDAGPATVSELAAAASADPGALGRLLRAGATAGLFTEDGDGRFALTPLGAQLKDDEVAGSLRDFANSLTAPGMWLPMGRLDDAVVSGQPQDAAALGTEVWNHYAAHPEEGAAFAKSMSTLSADASAAVLRCWDPSPFRRIVDVGGSNGMLLAGLLEAAPQATGVLFDRPEVAERARTWLAARGLADRVDVIGGDFFDDVPTGGDLYLLKSVLHDWDDERALRILRSVHRSARPGSCVAIVEGALPSQPGPSFAHLLNLLMLVVASGRERTVEELAGLLRQAGFRLQRTVPVTGAELGYPWAVIEAIRQ